MFHLIRWRFAARLVFLFLAGFATARAASVAAMPHVGADDPRFSYEGRIDRANPREPVLIWSATRVRIDFEGPTLAVDFDGGVGQNFFNATVDGVTTVLGPKADGPVRLSVPVPAGRSRHTFDLFKRSEAAAGQIRFTGIDVADGATVTRTALPVHRPRFAFFGDSIMVGACNEDGAADQWEDRRTHNNALSYTALTAAAFGADTQCIAISGMGISIGFVKIVAAEAWDRMYPSADAARDDLALWPPDLVFINYGENDSGYPSSHGLPFPSDYTPRYVSLVRTMRTAFPQTHFVLLRGGMGGGANNPKLRSAWEEAVAELEKSDPGVSHFVFQHWSKLHPRVADDRAMADELVAWLRQQSFVSALRIDGT
ncbi:MAG TPA: GDSL-type esterase/lipase family protein [Candidatus Didemnitutus sp.]|jgi:lysophospholipase L1-like esterase